MLDSKNAQVPWLPYCIGVFSVFKYAEVTNEKSKRIGTTIILIVDVSDYPYKSYCGTFYHAPMSYYFR
jgi:hypothetical protein